MTRIIKGRLPRVTTFYS